MLKNNIYNVSPIDGRYSNKTEKLQTYFSEFALIKYRLIVEIEYFIHLCNNPNIKNINIIEDEEIKILKDIYLNFNLADSLKIKEIESVTNHDVKAVEYFIKNTIKEKKMKCVENIEFVHFGLTSQDINNTAIPLSLKEFNNDIFFKKLIELSSIINKMYDDWKNIPMLSRTHGQAASSTTLGKEMKVYAYRIDNQIKKINNYNFSAKFGGAVGNLNAHYIAYKDIDWMTFADNFIANFQLERELYTTQISNYDNISEFLQIVIRLNNIFIDFCRDIWHYISIDYFKLKLIKDEVGSSAMPHKVNPIDFENAEGNLMIANSIMEFLCSKLPISRLQRDLTDSTVLRNIGVPFAHSIIAFESIIKGINKLSINSVAINNDLENNWAITAEAIQTILRREKIEGAYEIMKDLTRNNNKITKQSLDLFIDNMSINENIKTELKSISPHNYIGKFKD